MRFLTVVGIVVLMWVAGLFAFAERVRSLTPASEPARADAIVALTGPSQERINTAIRLLEAGKGERLLVSGVNREVRRSELRAVTTGPNRLYDCCIDLGFDAEDTMGNAQEIGAWARAKGFNSLIVVTSDYHMPRSILEIRGMAPEVDLTAHAVRTESLDSAAWFRSGTGLRRMTLEYCKYLVVLARESVLGVVGDRAAPDDRDAARAQTS
jgi:uncharacterized SAM-binding protein YcdF (DUF218 family)